MICLGDFLIGIIIIGVVFGGCFYFYKKMQKEENELNHLYSSFRKLYEAKTDDELLDQFIEYKEEYDKIVIEAHYKYKKDHKEDPIDSFGNDRSYYYKININKSITIQCEIILDIIEERKINFELYKREAEYNKARKEELEQLRKMAVKINSRKSSGSQKTSNKEKECVEKKKVFKYITDDEYDDEEEM